MQDQASSTQTLPYLYWWVGAWLICAGKMHINEDVITAIYFLYKFCNYQWKLHLLPIIWHKVQPETGFSGETALLYAIYSDYI